MPAKKGVAKSAAHKKSISRGVTSYNKGGTKTRDGVKSNNVFDSKKRRQNTGGGGAAGSGKVSEAKAGRHAKATLTSGGSNPKKTVYKQDASAIGKGLRGSKQRVTDTKNTGRRPLTESAANAIISDGPSPGPSTHKGKAVFTPEDSTVRNRRRLKEGKIKDPKPKTPPIKGVGGSGAFGQGTRDETRRNLMDSPRKPMAVKSKAKANRAKSMAEGKAFRDRGDAIEAKYGKKSRERWERKQEREATKYGPKTQQYARHIVTRGSSSGFDRKKSKGFKGFDEEKGKGKGYLD